MLSARHLLDRVGRRRDDASHRGRTRHEQIHRHPDLRPADLRGRGDRRRPAARRSQPRREWSAPLGVEEPKRSANPGPLCSARESSVSVPRSSSVVVASPTAIDPADALDAPRSSPVDAADADASAVHAARPTASDAAFANASSVDASGPSAGDAADLAPRESAQLLPNGAPHLLPSFLPNLPSNLAAHDASVHASRAAPAVADAFHAPLDGTLDVPFAQWGLVRKSLFADDANRTSRPYQYGPHEYRSDGNAVAKHAVVDAFACSAPGPERIHAPKHGLALDARRS